MEGEMRYGSAVYVLREFGLVNAVVGESELAVGAVGKPVHVVLDGGVLLELGRELALEVEEGDVRLGIEQAVGAVGERGHVEDAVLGGAGDGQGGSLDYVPKEIMLRSEECLGIFLAKRKLGPSISEGTDMEDATSDGEDEASDGEDDSIQAGGRKSVKKDDERVRGKCSICKRKSEYVCHGCGRSLCLSHPPKKALQKVLDGRKKKNEKKKKSASPKKKKKKNGKASSGGGGKRKKTSQTKKKGESNPALVETKIKGSYPALFCVEVPKTSSGRIQLDGRGQPRAVKEYGEYTCYHIAHHEAWKKHLHKTQQAVIEQLYEYIEGSPSEAKPKKRKRGRGGRSGR